MHGVVISDRGLREVTTLLVALAALADRAATRALPVRWLVLVFLRVAESVGMNLVVEFTGWSHGDLEGALATGHLDDQEIPAAAGSTPADALALGMRLRILAALLRAFLPPEDDLGRGLVRGAAALVRAVARPVPVFAAPAVAAHPAPDTS